MSGLLLMEKLPGKWMAFILAYLMPASLFLRYLITSVEGTFLLAVSLYWLTPLLSDVRPWTAGELLMWIDDLPVEAKTGIFTSLLTVVGFLVAFRSATEAWKRQALGEIKLRIAAELDAFSREADNLLTGMKIDAEHMLDAAKSYRVQGPTNEQNHATTWAIERGDQFKISRQRIATMSAEIHRIVGSNFAVLASVPGASNWMDQYVEALISIRKKMWIFIPQVPDDPKIRSAYYADKVKVEAYEEFIACCEGQLSVMAGLIGGIKGALLHAVIPANLYTYFALRRHRTKLPQAFSSIQIAARARKGGK